MCVAAPNTAKGDQESPSRRFFGSFNCLLDLSGEMFGLHGFAHRFDLFVRCEEVLPKPANKYQGHASFAKEDENRLRQSRRDQRAICSASRAAGRPCPPLDHARSAAARAPSPARPR